jgi:low affinity Fe/Cu permease
MTNTQLLAASKDTNGDAPRHPLTRFFRRVSQKTGKIVGSPWTFMGAVIFVLVWFLSGPYFGYSTNWQLVINTTTTIATFLIVFLLQNTQNRDTKALHLKLDELIYVNRKARNALLEAEEELDDEEMKRESQEFKMKRKNSAY